MSIDYFWKRVPEARIADLSPWDLAGLVPGWFDDEFAAQVREQRLVGAEDTGAMVGALLGCGVTSDASRRAVEHFVIVPDNWDDNAMTGYLPAADVRTIAEFLATAQPGAWARQHAAALAARFAELGYQRPYEPETAAEVVETTEAVAALFRAAATNGEAVILKVEA
ncbi:hypothetical protein BJY16_006997 [Actinoplanes octamycinicus]|uniref:DUF1877 family protein n=1 Tax=Actinoplanes octamycinicus TaxID=135948 RepID=A0A7W7MAY6_9ACTN|nr:hypothetical protein [Actinoplanes octamycinicus]MBB4743538.1 hypothetical protein [Actinoplanes octamycinicus]GIE62476.1 hypothetical protein Aoc01nite_78780 [Actinoplanes octamycinicus]